MHIKLKIHFSDTLPLLRKVFYYMYIYNTYIIHSDEEGWGKDSQRHLGMGSLHRKFIGSDIEGR